MYTCCWYQCWWCIGGSNIGDDSDGDSGSFVIHKVLEVAPLIVLVVVVVVVMSASNYPSLHLPQTHPFPSRLQQSPHLHHYSCSSSLALFYFRPWYSPHSRSPLLHPPSLYLSLSHRAFTLILFSFPSLSYTPQLSPSVCFTPIVLLLLLFHLSSLSLPLCSHALKTQL